MNTKYDIYLSIIIFFLIIFYKSYQFKRYKLLYRGNLYKKSNSICKLLLLISLLLCLSSLIVFYVKDILDLKHILLSLSIFVCCLPINLFNMYRMFFIDEEKYSHIKTIITSKIPDKEIFKKYIKAGINIIIFSKEKTSYKIEKLGIKDINKKNLKKNCIINSTNISLVDSFLKDNEIIINNDLEDLYNNIYHARGVHDNYIRCIKYLFVLYFSIIASNLVFILGNFPICMNLSIILLFKLFNLFCIEFIFKDLKYDTDIMDRNVKDKDVIIGKQELLLLFMISILILFGISLPYMFLLIQSSYDSLPRAIYFVVLIYCMLFFNYYNYSEKIYIINIFNSFKSIRMIIYLILSIIMSLVLSKLNIFYVSDMVLKNYFGSILVAFIVCSIFDLFKFSRWLSNRRR